MTNTYISLTNEINRLYKQKNKLIDDYIDMIKRNARKNAQYAAKTKLEYINTQIKKKELQKQNLLIEILKAYK